MHGALNVNNDVPGRLYPVEICLVIVQDCVQNLHGLKGIISIKENGARH